VFGRLLKGVHAGESKLIWNQRQAQSPASIVLSSPAFEDGTPIPQRFAGKSESPPLNWNGVSDEAVELVLVIEDPDAPIPVPSVHLIATGIPPSLQGVAAGAFSSDEQMARFRIGKGLLGSRRYRGPMPPPGHGPHRYFFQLFALKHALSSDRVFDRNTLLTALEGAVLCRGCLIGTYERL
jgi:Raf kinase inhibitor-like YbhB/YbcL family protein